MRRAGKNTTTTTTTRSLKYVTRVTPIELVFVVVYCGHDIATMAMMARLHK
jgi:hypothetical protein